MQTDKRERPIVKRGTFLLLILLMSIFCLAGCGGGSSGGSGSFGGSEAGGAIPGSGSGLQSVLSSIQLDPASPSIAIGSRLKINITGIYSDGLSQDISSICQCTSSNPDVATFDDTTDIATALKSGTTTITSKEPSSGVTGTTIITVTDVTLQSLQVTPVNPRIGVGASQQFMVTGIYADNSRIDFTQFVSYTSSVPNIATIDSKGLARGIDAGQTTITAQDPATHMSGTTLLIVGSNVQAPSITGISPSSLKAGDECTITGSGFGTQDGRDTRGSGMVYFGSYPSTRIISWSDTTIVCVVPEGIPAGTVTIMIQTASSETSPSNPAAEIVITVNSGGGGGGGGGASSGAVHGVVKDIETGAPLSGVSISYGSLSAATDAAGAFNLTMPTGNYTLTASAPGYLTTFRTCDVSVSSSTTVNWSLTKTYGNQDVPALTMDYTVLAWNDLGMHCCQDDYSYFLILPPFNTVHVQVIQRGIGPVTDGITVSYSFPKKTDSTLYNNFWTFAASYGWNALAPNVGITGTPLGGDMKVDDNKLGFVAQGIPVTPYDDDGTWDPFGAATITVKDSATGNVLQTSNVVVPVSTELHCENCHSRDNPQLTQLDILQRHDLRNGTTLEDDRENGVLHMCAECHADNALGAPGKPGIKSFSLAMHNFHKDKINAVPDDGMGGCYNCHPGPKTQCLRGIMHRAGMVCKDCHGSMGTMADSITAGRQPWLQEPKCGTCHGEKHKENDNTLFRNSIFNNSWDPKMSGQLYCEACHNSTHGELTTSNPADQGISQQFQGDNFWIWNCFVCHTDLMTTPSIHK